MDEVNIKLYDIMKCGYYKNRSKVREFCSTSEVFEQITEWYKGKPLNLTSTFNPPDDSSILKAFIMDIKKAKSGNYYLTLWNEVPSSDEKAVAAISETSTIEKLDIQFHKFGDSYIPGFATYFFVIPSKEILATIRFNRSYNGHKNFKCLIDGFLLNNPNYADSKKKYDDGTVIIEGYSTQSGKIAIPRFETYSRKKSGPIDFIKNNITKTTSLYCRPYIVEGNEEGLTIYNKLLNIIGITTKKQLTEAKVKVEYKLPCELKVQDFNQIYNKWTEADSEINDIGFSIGNEIIWLGHEIQKCDQSMNIKKINNEIYDLNSILKKIEPQLEEIINACSKDTR